MPDLLRNAGFSRIDIIDIIAEENIVGNEWSKFDGEKAGEEDDRCSGEENSLLWSGNWETFSTVQRTFRRLRQYGQEN